MRLDSSGRMMRLISGICTRPFHRAGRIFGAAHHYAKIHGGWGKAVQRVCERGYRRVRDHGVRNTLKVLLNSDLTSKYLQVENILRHENLQKEFAARIPNPPRISIVVPVYRVAPTLLEKCIQSVVQQYYSHWELILVDDGSQQSKLTEMMQDWAERDARIRLLTFEANRNISAATNEGIESATGDWIGFLDHDDELTRDALLEVVRKLRDVADTDVIYTDSDKIDSKGWRSEPFYKPDWSPNYFRSVMYVGHFLVAKRALIQQVGGCRSEFDGVQDYDLMLRLSEVTDRIEHIPRVLYHWRVIPGSLAADESAKPRIRELQEQAVQEHLDRTHTAGKAKSAAQGHRVIVNPVPNADAPRVSILIPTRDRPELIGPCLQSLFGLTDYPNFEVILGDNETRDPKALRLFEQYPVQRVSLPGSFHFAAFNNRLAEEATGDHLLLLNNDTEITQADWLQRLVFYASQPGIGAVGPKLLYDDRTVQHAGVILGPRGTADHLMRYFAAEGDGYAGSLTSVREVSAVTGACLLVNRDHYQAVGGLEESFQRHYEDVDFCLQLRDLGLSNLYVGSVELIHHESKTRGSYYDYTDRVLLLDRWEEWIKEGDPFYNPNFHPRHVDYTLAVAT